MNVAASINLGTRARRVRGGAAKQLVRSRGFRPGRRALAITVAALLVVSAATWLLVRNSGLVAVEQVRVVGLSGYYDRAARRAVAGEAQTMTTMNVSEDRIAEVAGRYVNVAGVRTDANFPHGLTVYVDVRRTVAAAKLGARTVAVTATGVTVDNARNLSALPNIEVSGVLKDGRVTDRRALGGLSVLGAAPDVLLRRVKTLRWGRDGLTLVLDKGVRLIFGNRLQAAAKWSAAAAILGKTGTRGAHYVDLRVPDRPAIGGLGPAPVTLKPQPLAEPTAATTTATTVAGATGAVATPPVTTPPVTAPQQSPPAAGQQAPAAPQAPAGQVGGAAPQGTR